METKESILNEDFNNKQKERVRRDFKDKIHHHGIKKEEARESLNDGSHKLQNITIVLLHA